MRDTRSQLRKELHQAGANAAEVDELLPIASQLSRLSPQQARSAKSSTFHLVRLLRPVVFTASGLALGMLLIIISQVASPTSILYPVQKISDGVAIDVHPQYRATVMMKRAQQVNQLVSEHASSKKVLATLADYTAEASAYRSMPHANYSAFEFCKTNLEQAAASASPEIKHAISSSLQSLETT